MCTGRPHSETPRTPQARVTNRELPTVRSGRRGPTHLVTGVGTTVTGVGNMALGRLGFRCSFILARFWPPVGAESKNGDAELNNSCFPCDVPIPVVEVANRHWPIRQDRSHSRPQLLLVLRLAFRAPPSCLELALSPNVASGTFGRLSRDRDREERLRVGGGGLL